RRLVLQVEDQWHTKQLHLRFNSRFQWCWKADLRRLPTRGTGSRVVCTGTGADDCGRRAGVYTSRIRYPEAGGVCEEGCRHSI
ncbi:hypothetical protein LTR48_007475, partial [Friedmanniomyces endolithicus]